MIVDGSTLENARVLADVTVYELWLRYFTLGGTASSASVRELLRGGHQFGAAQYDMLVHALNERFVELDLGRPVAYADDA